MKRKIERNYKDDFEILSQKLDAVIKENKRLKCKVNQLTNTKVINKCENIEMSANRFEVLKENEDSDQIVEIAIK